MCLAIILCLALHPCRAQQNADERLDKGIARARQHVEAATQDLNALRDRISNERLALAQEAQELQGEVLRLRAEAERLQTLRYQDGVSREALQRDVARMQDEHTFILMLLQEYRRSLETRIEVAESHALGPRMKEVDLLLHASESATNLLAATRTFLNHAENWNLGKLGGSILAGYSLDEDGKVSDGVFAVLGPASYVASTDAAGLVVRKIGSSRPSMVSRFDPQIEAAIADLVAGKEAMVPLDVTGGDALKVASRKVSLKEHLVSGGFVMIPLLAIGVLALFLTLWKMAALSRIRTPADEILTKVAEQVRGGRIQEAQVLVGAMAQPFRSVLQTGVDHRALRREHLEEILHERALATMPTLDRHLGMLAVLGGVAPLLGLLGTVTGMIHTFELVTIFGTGDARLLSGGISEALVTTEIGLVIAVPVLLVHAYLARRVRTTVSDLEQSVAGFLNGLYVEEQVQV